MTSLTSWFWGASQIDDAVEKATSELIPAGTEDVALNLEICDQIRSKSAPAKDAMRALKRRLNHKNPNVQILALGLTDICVKNGGDHFLVEIASREFIDNLVSILKIPSLNHAVKSDILKYIQNWALAFEGKPSFSYVGQIYKTLKNEGYEFPPKDLALANSAMVDTSTAPEWIDSDVCLRCRTPFTLTNRKHHCRNCGQVFDHQCSSKSIPLPHFGITQPVRVCDSCHLKLTRKSERMDRGRRHSASIHNPRSHSTHDPFDAELQRAIQVSLEEVGMSPTSTKRRGYVPYESQPYYQSPEPPVVDHTTRPVKDRRKSMPPATTTAEDEDDPDLRAAIEASLREANMPKPSAPAEVASADNMGRSSFHPSTVAPTSSAPKVPDHDLEPLESDAILTFNQTIEQLQSQGGRDMSRYPAVGELFDKANGLRPKLAMSLDDTGRKEQLLAEMHEKLSQAVKLYDKLLSNQISNPVWRRTTSMESGRASVLPPGSAYMPAQSQGPSQYNEWARAPAHAAPGDSVPFQVPQSPALHTPFQPTYAPPPPPVSITSVPSHSYYSAPEQEPQRQMTSPPVLSPESHLQRTTQPAPATPSPPSLTSPVSPSITSPVRSTLVRANTIPSRPSIASPPPPAQPHSSIARSTTISHAPPMQARPQSFSRAQPAHAQQFSPPQPFHHQPTSLPAFPSVPTSTPQSFDLYAPSVPSAAPQEKREEMLIEL